ncbi:hypothetical protein HU200_055208 [Digitaria exilis]|uniref:Plus3 domain-containing protein n=1 Tax=Digitaria exilis TaxID=1010633 RepID=A0A835E3J6_9POAL|nr:hypothetical protein HU200_055208 [Digitaria exilis]
MSPLSELVWSPNQGLSIKIAASSLSTRKASLRWNADTLSIVISSPQQSGAGGAKSSDNIYDTLEASEKMPSQLRTRSDSSVRVTANPNRIANFDALQSTSMRSQEQDSSKSERQNLIQKATKLVECYEGINVMNEGKEGSGNCCVNQPEDMEVGSYPTRCCKDASHSNTQCPASRKEIMASISENQESHKNEPVVVRGEPVSAVNAVAKCESTPGVDARKLEKGKEKIMYNESNCISNTKESDDSNESIQSCTSTKAPKRKHAMCSEARPTGNKRFRRGDNESSCSGLLEKCGSSFFNWMSSLTNGLPMLDETTAAVPFDQKFSASTGERSAALPLPLQNNSGAPMHSVGFNSLFQSLYTHNVMITSKNNCHQPESNCTGHVFNRLTMELNNSTSVLDRQNGIGRETIDEYTVGCSNGATRNKGGFGESLWVSRLLPKTPLEVMEATPCNVESAVNPKAVDERMYCPSLSKISSEKELNDIQNLAGRESSNGATSSKCPAVPPEEPKHSETMASVFAKRLDALRHAKTSAVRLAITCDRGMPKLNKHKTTAYVVSYSSHDEVEVGHETHKSSSGNGRILLWADDKSKEQLCTQNNEELRGKFLSGHEHQDHGRSPSGKSTQHNLEVNTLAEDIDTRRVELKGGASDVMPGLPDNKQIVPYGIMPDVICDDSSAVFVALHRLRLSRSDIIRWLRSPVMHTTLDGFFVRLRFGKWEEALGGTGYHVARLNGALDRNRLSVTIRNSTCQVDSRFVSNHDFHEDELKAWWSAAMKGEWKLPSKEELSMKLRERELFCL